jgi:hypothetical protein
MTGKRLLLVEDKIGLRLELIAGWPGGRDAAGAFDRSMMRIHLVGIDAIRALAHQPEDHRPARSVADAGMASEPCRLTLIDGHIGAGTGVAIRPTGSDRESGWPPSSGPSCASWKGRRRS